MTESPIPNPLWIKIAAAAGGLPDTARGQVTDAINSYGEVSVQRVIRSDAREAVGKALKKASELSNILSSLEQNREFQQFKSENGPVEVTDIVDARRLLIDLGARLLRDRDRLNQRSSRGWPVVEASALVTTLLEIRTDCLTVDAPTTAKDSTRAGPFLEYVRLCVRYADPELKESQIDKAINSALRGFQERRRFEPENFPSVQRPIVKKND